MLIGSVPVSITFSFIFSASVLEAIDLDFEVDFGDFFESGGARETKMCFHAKPRLVEAKPMFSRVGGLPRSSKSCCRGCVLSGPAF